MIKCGTAKYSIGIFYYFCKIKQKNMIESGRILPGKVLVKEIPPWKKSVASLLPMLQNLVLWSERSFWWG